MAFSQSQTADQIADDVSWRVLWRVAVIILLLLVIPTLLALPYRRTETYLSCAQCRSTRVVSSSSYFGVPFPASDHTEVGPHVPAGHQHSWWRYSLHRTSGFITTLGCKATKYEDGISN
jgi:hypothetical protein